jgi:hypothetical protein
MEEMLEAGSPRRRAWNAATFLSQQRQEKGEGMTRMMIKQLLGKPRENEQFALCGGLVVFDVWKSYQMLLEKPRDPFYISTEQGWLENVTLLPEKYERADISRAGMLAYLAPDYACLIDGNHRLAKRQRLGFQDMSCLS